MMNRILAALLFLIPCLSFGDMLPMDNADLDAVTGQQGVAISLDWRLNADASGNVLPLCTGVNYKECRVGWAFNNRGIDDCGGNCTTNIGKKWLMLKGFSGALYIPYLTVDASSVTYNRKASAGGGTNTVSAIKLSMGDPATSAYSGASTKVQIKQLIIDNMSFEQDTASVRGYFTDATTEPTGAAIPSGVNTGFLALTINGPGNVANVQVDGTVKLFPCLADHQSC